MGMNYYLRQKRTELLELPLEDVLREGYVPAGPQTVRVYADVRCHIAKTSWGWKPSFQAVPSHLPFDGQAEADKVFSIRSVRDIRNYYGTGRYEIVDEDGEAYSWEEFETRVLHWEDRMRDICEARGMNGFEPRTHMEGDLGDFVDPEGYEFCTTCFC